jgi:ADP-heptose:LPS heptosyltransferase
MRIIISPYSQKLRNGKDNPKNYPYWQQLIELLHEHELIQIGVHGEEKLVEDCRFNLSFKELRELIKEVDFFISTDNFFQHFCHHYNKHGIVIWGQSDPLIFGYEHNINLLKDRKYLREKQFWLWEQCEYKIEVFVTPEEIIKKISYFS